MPLVHWMRKELKDGLLPILLEPRTLQRGYFEPHAISTVMDEHFRGVRDRAGLLWILLVFELWHRNFLEAKTSEAPGTSPHLSLQNVLSPGGAVS
jgi:asparagine synthase (glutamine-hydrolysing)